MRRSRRQVAICLVIGVLPACSASQLGGADASAPDSGTGASAPDSGTGASVPDSGTDVSAPVPGCPATQGPIDGKITEANRMRFEATNDPTAVLIMVAGGAQIGPLPECPDRTQPCPERDRITSEWEAANLASQRCVRELIASIGGTADPTTFMIIDAFSATLTWDQIQVVAAHPHVLSIEASNPGIPPP